MRWVLCLTMFAALGFAPAPVYKPSKNDTEHERLRGTWRSSAFRVDGRNFDMEATWKFDNGNIDIEQFGGILGCSYLVDTKSNPKVIEVQILGRVSRILYKIEGDSLTVCYDEKSSAALAFGGQGIGRTLIVFERRKDR